MTEIERIKSEKWLPENFWNAETICDFYVTEERKKIWAIAMDLYREFARICELHGLRYFVCAGTLLGAVRHKGFIPWDDDLDVCMPRADYEKLKTIKFAEPYFLQDYTTDKEYGISFMKLRNSNTTYHVPAFEHLHYNHGMLIDIFPLDEAEPNEFGARYDEIKSLIMKNSAAMRVSKPNKTERDEEIIREYYEPEKLGGGIHDNLKKLHAIASARKNENCSHLAGICCTIYKKEHQIYRKEVFDSVVELEFNGIKVKAPVLYEELLEVKFGNWKELPPIETRGKWHEGKFIPEIPYKEYFGR